MLWALVRLQHSPPREFVEPLLDRALQCMRTANAQDCSLLLWGLAKCGCRAPGDEWMGQFCARTLQVTAGRTTSCAFFSSCIACCSLPLNHHFDGIMELAVYKGKLCKLQLQKQWIVCT